MNAIWRTLVIGIPAVMLALACTHWPEGVGEGPVPEWTARFPDAARDLCLWTHQNRDAAKSLFQWDHFEPDRSHDFINWSLSTQGSTLDGFLAAHPYWRGYEWLLTNYRPALVAFVAWCRHYPDAVRDLQSYSDGLGRAAIHSKC